MSFLLVSISAGARADNWVIRKDLARKIDITYLYYFVTDPSQSDKSDYEILLQDPPALSNQGNIQVDMMVNDVPVKPVEVPEGSPEHRSLYHIQLKHSEVHLVDLPGEMAGKRGMVLKVRIRADMYSRQAVPAGASDVPASGVSTTISDNDRQMYLKPTTTYDFTSPTFQDFLSRNQLTRRPQETVEAFGSRLYGFMRERYTYDENPAHQVEKSSALCTEKTLVCGTASIVYVGVCRSNGIPARLVNGINLHGISDGPDPGGHAQVELFVEGKGWLPVDVTSGIKFKGQDEGRYGRDRGDLFVFHVDTDLVPVTTQWGARESLKWLQLPQFYPWHAGCAVKVGVTQTSTSGGR